MVAFFIVIFMAFGAQFTRAADEAQIRRDCTADALRYCKAAIPQGRDAIISCMVRNQPKLRPVCRRHIWSN